MLLRSNSGRYGAKRSISSLFRAGPLRQRRQGISANFMKNIITSSISVVAGAGTYVTLTLLIESIANMKVHSVNIKSATYDQETIPVV